jgi:signal transduction histidine kinase
MESDLANHLERRLRALVLGAIDMYDAWETARYLLGDHPEAAGHAAGAPWRVRRTMETGMIVTYARPFVDSRGHGLPRLKRAVNLTAEFRASHEEILSRRNAVYAHTDETPLRRILELSDPARLEDWLSEPGGELSEEWHPPTGAMLGDVIVLTTAHLASFLQEIDARRAQRLASALDS